MSWSTPPPQLFQHWVHVAEEDTRDVRVYRPADSPLPPARGRDGIEFRPDGTLCRYLAGPADRPVGRDGAWRVAAPDTVEITTGEDADRYVIESVGDGELRLRE